MTADATFAFCIGAPKAGTTWLYNYLSGHPDCHLRGVKETHFFDWRNVGPDVVYHPRQVARAEHLRKTLASVPFWRRRASLGRQLAEVEDWLDLHRHADPETGCDRLKAYLLGGRARQRVVGDITPCYMTLDRTGFAQMVALAPDVRIVFLLRDPVDRAWSHIRMVAGRRAPPGTAPEAIAPRLFDRFLDGGNAAVWARSDYARTVQELTAAVPRARIHVEFYEHLFTPDALDRLTGFLGIAMKEGDFDTVRNKGASVPLDEPRKLRARQLLDAQYTVGETLADGRLPERWRAHMALAG